MRELKTLGIIVGIIYFLSFHWLIFPTNYVRYKGMEAQIEQLKKDSLKITKENSEDVIGLLAKKLNLVCGAVNICDFRCAILEIMILQITQINQDIAMAQSWNKIFIIDLYIPDMIDEFETIGIPEY